MKSILQSIKPQYCELIASGKKTIEVRKTRPKLDVPFKVYIYCTKGENLWKKGNSVFLDKRYNRLLQTFDHMLNGKVIGEYVCDRIDTYESVSSKLGSVFIEYKMNFEQLSNTHLSINEFCCYGKGKILYGWHISDLKIYDKPKELSEFGNECNLDCPSIHCPYWKYQRVNADEWDYDCSCNNIRPLTHPPQSWCYVEEGQ